MKMKGLMMKIMKERKRTRDSDGDIEGDEEEEENLLVGELLHQKAFQGMIEKQDDSCGHHFASLYCSLSFLQHHQQ